MSGLVAVGVCSAPEGIFEGRVAFLNARRLHARSSHARMTHVSEGVAHMLNAINISHVFVADQDKALDFYVGKLGLEVSDDQDLGFMRWLTVRVPGQPGRDILLETPGPPAMDDAAARQVRELI